jgi:hypothetical protein
MLVLYFSWALSFASISLREFIEVQRITGLGRVAIARVCWMVSVRDYTVINVTVINV